MDIKSIARTAAVIYADNMSHVTTKTIKRKFIEAVFVNNGNKQITIAELANQIEAETGLQFSEEEIKPIVIDKDHFIEVLNKSSEDVRYNLQDKRYINLCSKSVDEIENVIDNYLIMKGGSIPLGKEDFKELIYRYLHAILNSNISAYSHIVNPKKMDSLPKLKNLERFEEEEIDYINDFIRWDNEEKNKAIFKLINYCIEYAIVVNDSTENVLSESLRTKVFYLDNSLLYRALGINGETRKKRALSFLKKCKESGQKFVVSKFTRQEFEDTVNYHLGQLNSSTPFGNISPQAFKRYANGDGFYQFYHGWRNGRINYGFDLFKTYIHSLYKDLVKQFDIDEDFNVPFDEKDEPKKIAKYADEIQSIKNTNKMGPHLMDARNMYWIECKREGNNYDIASTKYYFITADQKLQLWDNDHSVDQPLTLLPSQWMGLLLKYVSRSSDDYKSFVSFMNLPKDNSVISEDDLQAVMAGISSMTEEFAKQESIIESMVEMKFGDILKGDIHENAKAFAKDKLEKEFEKKLAAKEEETLIQLAKKEDEKKELEKIHKQLLLQVQEEAKKQFAETEKERKLDKLKSIIKEIGDIETRMANAENHAWDRYTRRKWITGLIILGPIALWIYVVYINDWGLMEKKTYFPPVVYFFASVLYILIYEKSFNLKGYFKKLHNKYLIEEYDDFGCSASELLELKTMRDELKNELNYNNELNKEQS